MWCYVMKRDFSDAFDEQIDSPKDVSDGTPKNDQTHGFIAGVSLNDFVAYMPQHLYIFMPARELWPAASVTRACGRQTLILRASPFRQPSGSTPIGPSNR